LFSGSTSGSVERHIHYRQPTRHSHPLETCALTVATSTESATTPFGYAGQYTDTESGYQYLRARYYDPATGQFITRDPIEDVTGDPYGYADGNPIINTDPSGLLGMPSLQQTSDFSAGAGDWLSGGFLGVLPGVDGHSLTSAIRDLNGTNDVVNKCSDAYGWGEKFGEALGTTAAPLGVLKLAGPESSTTTRNDNPVSRAETRRGLAAIGTICETHATGDTEDAATRLGRRVLEKQRVGNDDGTEYGCHREDHSEC
jgi:RHS repeat-associated protein